MADYHPVLPKILIDLDGFNFIILEELEEIVDVYINRYYENNRHNGYFIWITDVFQTSPSVIQIDKGFRNYPFLLNIFFVRKGFFE